MRLPRTTMSTTLFVSLVLAIDLGVARHLIRDVQGIPAAIGLGFLPMATALVFGLYRLLRLRGRNLPFTLGFQVAGMAATGGYLAALKSYPVTASQFLTQVAGSLENGLEQALVTWKGRAVLRNNLVEAALELAILVILFTLPPLLIALSGGLFARKIGRKTHRVA